ncbi:MAG: GNAT family N-acetyltransferase [Bacteroidota bacterium]|nr:GNAT family N-acetyltransferase [Bacteroidota bacterium]
MNSFYENSKDDYLISTDPSKLNIEVIHKYLSQESYWAKDIPFETVKRSIEHSLCFGLYHQQQQLGFARLITDKATFAYLADVFVLKEYRGKGLSKFLLATIQSHPELQNLRRWLLGTKDAHGLYEQFGWTRVTEELSNRFMTRHNPDVYRKVE